MVFMLTLKMTDNSFFSSELIFSNLTLDIWQTYTKNMQKKDKWSNKRSKIIVFKMR
jgi:hypothetical protein